MHRVVGLPFDTDAGRWIMGVIAGLYALALISGVVTEAEVDPEAARTDPAELCADVLLAGESLPEQLRPYAEAQKKAKKRHLPLAPARRVIPVQTSTSRQRQRREKEGESIWNTW